MRAAAASAAAADAVCAQAGRLRKAPADLRIYGARARLASVARAAHPGSQDPYYCSGAMVAHMAAVGFPRVQNMCEDFYAVQRAERVPEHDVVVTNPPYSADHVERLLRWARDNGKPFFLLMPNYVCAKPYYAAALGDASVRLLALVPKKRWRRWRHPRPPPAPPPTVRARYAYWTPRGLRAPDKVQKQHVGAGGAYRTSPFVSFWYASVGPGSAASDALQWWAQRRDAGGQCSLVRMGSLPSGVRP